MKKNAIIFAVLLILATVPVVVSFSGKGDDVAEGVAAIVEEAETDNEVPNVATKLSGAVKTPETPSAKAVKQLDRALVEVAKNPAKGKTTGGKAPVFTGFEKQRYQQYDAIIERMVADFNARRTAWAGCTGEQAADIKPLTAAQVKAHMIQETGGGDVRSRAAWAKDPLQVNVPGDWTPYKKYLGLREPRKRNEGSFEKNLKAGIMLLARKGFGVSGQPAANQPSGKFDGWTTSLRRYNGRSDKAADGRPYREAYAAKILERSKSPGREVPISIPTKK